MGSGLVGLYVQSALTGKFIISRNGPFLGEAVPPELAWPQMSKHQNAENQSPS